MIILIIGTTEGKGLWPCLRIIHVSFLSVLSGRKLFINFIVSIHFSTILHAYIFIAILLRDSLLCFAFTFYHRFFIILVNCFYIQSKSTDIFTYLTFLSFQALYLLKIFLFAVHEKLLVVYLNIIFTFLFDSSLRIKKVKIQWNFLCMIIPFLFLSRSVFLYGYKFILDFKPTFLKIVFVLCMIELLIGKIKIYLIFSCLEMVNTF
jgi:hypothetical protein